VSDAAIKEIANWLEKLGMSEYAQLFAENKIDVSVLRHLTDQDLKDIGVPLGHRRKMLAVITEHLVPAEAPPQPTLTEPKPQESAERRQVTVMFSDLVGSTALSARMDPEDLREVISAYQKCVAKTVQRFGGFVAKYMGDGVLVYFGYPQAHEDDAERAVRAGLELIQAVGGLKASAPLQTRVGIATGLVVVGDLIGRGSAQEQAVVGETPNIAARLQGVAEPNSVVIAESTRKLLGNLFDLQDLSAQDLKGIGSPVRAWAVLRPASIESRFEALHATGLTALVGREEELELLLRRWSKAKTGEGQVVLLSGEAGIGKSRLTAALLERLAGEPHTRLRNFCSPQHTDSALYPTIGQIERAAGFTHDDTPQAKLDKLDALLAQSSTSAHDAALLSDMLSLPNDGRYPALDLTPQERRQGTLDALVGQVAALSRQNPVLMIFEDAHWTDPTSLELFGRIVDRIPTLRVLLIVTFRPDFEAPWIGRPYVTALTINRLAEREIGTMIDRLIGNKPLSASVRQDIIERTDGIPLFAEEMTKAVLEAEGGGAAERTVAAVPSPALAVPATLHASLMARLDRLGPAKEVAQIGAAIGREFSHALLYAVMRKPEAELASALDRLIAAGLLFRQGVSPHATYLFKHALVQDAAYDTLLRSRRLQLHAQIAAILKRQFPEVVTAQPQLIARHCGEAGLNEEAVGYWLKAGQQAIERSAMVEAVTQLRKGLDLVANLPDTTDHLQSELEMQMAIGAALSATKGVAAPATVEAHARARALAEQLDRSDYLVPLLQRQYLYHLTRSEHRLALLIAEQIERRGAEQNNSTVLLLGHALHGMTSFFLGDFILARALFEQWRGLGNLDNRALYEIGDVRATVLMHQAVTLAHLGQIDQARSCVDEAAARVREHSFGAAFVSVHAGWVECVANSPHAARRHAEQAITLASEHRYPLWLGWGTIYRGWSLTMLGQPEEGLTWLRKGLSACRTPENAASVPFALILLTTAYLKLGRTDEALQCLAEAAQNIETSDERFYEAELLRLRGEVLNAIGDGAAAEQNYYQALATANRQSAKTLELRAAISLARRWRDQGKRDEARELLAPIFGWFTEGFDTLDLMEAKALLDELAS
jgi:class 3 adenylate cyclase/tetratricopeptide (TPR) repeat protein